MNEVKLKNSIKRITIFFVITSFLIFAFGIVASHSLTLVFKDTVSRQVKSQVQEYKTDINRKIQSSLQTLYILRSFFVSDEYINTETFQAGLYESNNQSNFIRMAYFDSEGLGIRVKTNGDIEKNINLDDINENAREVIAQAYNGENAISDVYYDSSLQQSVIAYAVPVKNGNEIKGVLAASQSVKILSCIMDRQSILSDEGIVMVVNSKGEVLSGSTKPLMENINNINDLTDISDEKKQEMLLSIADLKASNISITVNDSSYYAVIEPVNIRDWSIIVVDSDIGLNGSIYQNMNITRVTTIISLILAIICILYGYKQIKKNNNQLLKIAYYDSLTGAYNMEKFNMLLDDVWHKDDKKSAVVAINIRQFKFINEIFGSDMANKLLCHIKNLLDDNINENEFFCRENADLFFIFMHEDEPQKIIERINSLIHKINGIILEKHPKYPISIYSGVAFLSYCNDEREQLITRVMFALNRAKLNGKSNKIVFYDSELHKTEQLQNYIESHMNQALVDKEFKLFLQPKINLKNGDLYGAEALVRWITNDNKMIFPDQFIPLFEENGFCTKLDLYMVDEACKQLRNWIDKGYKPINIAVNQSKLLFYEEKYVEHLCYITQKHNIEPSLITIEILEGLALNNVNDINDKITRLKKYGFKISMDDFGSGYSSLNTLGNLDIDELKIDKNFLMIASETNGHRQKIIMGQIIALAKKMNMYTVVEGVETKENEQMIKELGCDFGQGYYYSRPINAKEFGEKYMKERKQNE